ncbi:MAG: type II toxin-antitoxin system RelE/ParE family toxin [Actinobacteria bacterium]|nr:type II toxin-antitoxin system RelE/ParE family toxin [Actinomycetota bacterium]
MYEVLIERRAEHDLKHLPRTVARDLIAAIQALAENPRPIGCRKIANRETEWRIRVGDYRVVYEVEDAHQVVRVLRAGHRR